MHIIKRNVSITSLIKYTCLSKSDENTRNVQNIEALPPIHVDDVNESVISRAGSIHIENNRNSESEHHNLDDNNITSQ